MPDLVEKTKTALKNLHILPRKGLGQNFMVSSQELSFISDALSLKEGEKVLEIGPGLGFLTRALLERGAHVIAVEKDRLLARRLSAEFPASALQVVEKDILKYGLAEDLGLREPIKVAGNIPYNITSPILEWLIDQRHLVSQVVLTTQWEVAQRLTAHPGTKIWGALSIFVQVYAQVSILKKISKANFFPVPKVDSAVVNLNFAKEPLFVIPNEEHFFFLVRRAFQKRRKTILNALADDDLKALAKEPLTLALQKAGINPIRRPETLSIPEWAHLSQLLLASG